jgi:hypothetical protein
MVSPAPAVLLFAVAALIPDNASAQWGRRFTIATGPAIGIDGTPPDAGVHFRSSVALDKGPRTLTLLADAYVTRLVPASETLTFTDGSIEFRDEETQIGIGLSGLVTLLRDRAVSPYSLVGAVYRRSDASERAVLRDAAGQITDQATLELTENQFDILLGLGTAIRSGSRRILIEARLYGGTVIYLPITVGLTF